MPSLIRLTHLCWRLQEYGSGRLHKKHSTFFAQMMTELGLNTREEHYFDLVPWQSLAAMNHNFLLTERRRHYLRYAGGLTFFEVRSRHERAFAGAEGEFWLKLVLTQCVSDCCETGPALMSDRHHAIIHVSDAALPVTRTEMQLFRPLE